MAVKILVPTALRAYSHNEASVEVEAGSVREALHNFVGEHPDLRKHLLTPEGGLRNFVNLYLNDEDIRYLKQEETSVNDGDVLSIVPSVAGGSQLPHLDKDEIARYSRHLIMPEVAMEGQRKLKSARVLMIGAGGLGSPLGLYLAAAGVGHLGIVDFDVVDFSNLQRQIVHGTSKVGVSKLESAKERLLDLNPCVDITGYELALNSDNALDIVKEYDVVVDGTDNFPTRYLVNDACVLLGKPNVYGSIFRFEGQASVFYAKEGPCYRCLYPEPPPPGLVPSCAEGGVLGILPGIIGTIQATEIIKLILGKGESLIGRLLLFDAMKMNFRELKLRKDPDCPICGEAPSIHALIDYQQFCGIGPEEEEEATEWDIEVEELEAMLKSPKPPLLLDVREPQEWDICKLPNATFIPVNEIAERVHELNTVDEIVVYCKAGVRSLRALYFLVDSGFRRVRNLRGGIDAWAERIDQTMPQY